MKTVLRPSKTVLLSLYEKMLLIRRVEEKIVQLYPQQEMRCPVHLSIGQEACASAVCTALGRQDLVFSTHRCHSHYLAKGGDLKGMFAELYGKATGCCRGKGGSMHLLDPEQGVMGASAIVGGTLPLAVGAGFTAGLEKKGRVAVAFFGDAATEQGVFHESLNFAALKKIPVLFVCENNFYATHTPLSERQVLNNIHERGEIYGVPGAVVEGDDAVAVYQAASEMVERARRGEGPSLLECRAYRWKEHVGPNEDYQLGYRGREEFEAWMERCPIKGLKEQLVKEGVVSAGELERLEKKIQEKIEEAVGFAQASSAPDPLELMKDID